MIFSEFKTVLAQNLKVEKLLPIEPERETAGARDHQPQVAGGLHLRAAAGRNCWQRCCRRTCEAQIFRAMARIVCVGTRRAHDGHGFGDQQRRRSDRQALTLYMNKVRQAAITKEIIEMVSGAASAASVRCRNNDGEANPRRRSRGDRSSDRCSIIPVVDKIRSICPRFTTPFA